MSEATGEVGGAGAAAHEEDDALASGYVPPAQVIFRFLFKMFNKIQQKAVVDCRACSEIVYQPPGI